MEHHTQAGMSLDQLLNEVRGDVRWIKDKQGDLGERLSTVEAHVDDIRRGQKVAHSIVGLLAGCISAGAGIAATLHVTGLVAWPW